MINLLALTLASLITLGVSYSEASPQGLNADYNCQSVVNTLEGAPFKPVHARYRREAIESARDSSILSEEDIALVLELLKRTDTEVYEPNDSNDAGIYLYIVDQTTCSPLWGGFIEEF